MISAYRVTAAVEVDVAAPSTRVVGTFAWVVNGLRICYGSSKGCHREEQDELGCRSHLLCSWPLARAGRLHGGVAASAYSYQAPIGAPLHLRTGTMFPPLRNGLRLLL